MKKLYDNTFFEILVKNGSTKIMFERVQQTQTIEMIEIAVHKDREQYCVKTGT